LISQLGGAGLSVTFVQSGTPLPVERGVELAVYRVVQEALTNALRYASGAEVTVELRHGAGAVELRIVDEGGDVSSGVGGGRGLVGMRERVTVYGGTLETGPLPSGGFEVRARLPSKAGP
jgi:signal transduction histidine kinase